MAAGITDSSQPTGLFAQSRSKIKASRKIYMIGELFSGAGGMVLGTHLAGKKELDQGQAFKYSTWLKTANQEVKACQQGKGRSRFKTAWTNDIDKDACASLEQNMQKADVHCCPVEELDYRKLSAIDGLAFGFPCKDFSLAGEQKGIEGRQGELYMWGIKALKKFKPAFFVAENVKGIKSANDGKDFEIILVEMKAAGYHVYCREYSFADYGVPQTRKRIIFLGFRKGIGVRPEDFEEFFNHPSLKVKKQVTCRQALAKIPKRAADQEFTKHEPEVIERLKHTKPGENVFQAEMPAHLKINTNTQISSIYRRLDPNKPAYTVTASGGGGDARLSLGRATCIDQSGACAHSNFPGRIHFSWRQGISTQANRRSSSGARSRSYFSLDS